MAWRQVAEGQVAGRHAAGRHVAGATRRGDTDIRAHGRAPGPASEGRSVRRKWMKTIYSFFVNAWLGARKRWGKTKTSKKQVKTLFTP